MDKKSRESISKAIQVLEEYGIEILTVTEWANKMGYSRAHFSRSFNRELGMTPKEYLRDYKLRDIAREIKKNPEAIGYEIAVNVGFIDERALHKYLTFHCNMTLTEYKDQLL